MLSPIPGEKTLQEGTVDLQEQRLYMYENRKI